MKGINTKEHEALVKTLQHLADVLAFTKYPESQNGFQEAKEIEEDINQLRHAYEEYELLLEKLSYTIENYQHLQKHLRFHVLAPTLRTLKKQMDAGEENYFLLRENLLETKNL